MLLVNLQRCFVYNYNFYILVYVYCVVCIVIHVISEPTEMFCI